MIQVLFTGKRSLIPSIITLIVGILFLVIPYDTLKGIFFTLLGLAIVLIYLFPCIYYWFQYSETNQYLFEAIVSTISVVVGFTLIFWHHFIISIILGIWLIVLPLIRIINSDNKVERLKKEIPYFLIAIILFFVPAEAIFAVVLKAFGALVAGYSIGNIIYILIQNHKGNNDNNPPSSPRQDRVIINAEVKNID